MQAMEYFIPFADVSLDGRVPRWYNAECAQAEAHKDTAFAAWAEARSKKAPDITAKKRAFNLAAKSYKKELFDLVKPSPFYHRTARHRKNLHRYVVEIPSTRTKRFASFFLIRTAKAWNALPSSVFPDTYKIILSELKVPRSGYLQIKSELASSRQVRFILGCIIIYHQV
ncbi:jg11943 [Pararge aegeria aegeria]|uniref:Jg11943 protein n=1 Tax=Pararge aegeria aegeria TaxID=348720 RepID=A0A8S4S8Y0_9NEOP|nr:jg11943 [Pararge aegeria aegeria]